MNVIKEVQVTDSFLGLDQSDRKCQDDEPYEDCVAESFIKAIAHKCNCLPFNLISEVNMKVKDNYPPTIQKSES